MNGQIITLGQYNTAAGWVPLTVTGAAFGAWSPATGNWSVISLHATYEPAPLPNFPTRTRPRGGELVSLPTVEAAALVTAGVASYASGWAPGGATQVGTP
jgi:hypothetical protein